jgi:hypothetical protein
MAAELASLNVVKMRTELLIIDFLMSLNLPNMKNTYNYIGFLKEKGKPLSAMNPGSDEICLTVKNALYALELLRDEQVTILGGDILSEENSELVYAYQLWGEDYNCLNWYCDRDDSESESDYLQRSYILAKNSIVEADKTARLLEKKCYIVFII